MSVNYCVTLTDLWLFSLFTPKKLESVSAAFEKKKKKLKLIILENLNPYTLIHILMVIKHTKEFSSAHRIHLSLAIGVSELRYIIIFSLLFIPSLSWDLQRTGASLFFPSSSSVSRGRPRTRCRILQVAVR